MMKVEALFSVPDDKERFLTQVKEEMLPFLYQMPYIEKIELTPCFDTPQEIQQKYLSQPLFYQIGVYYKQINDVGQSFGTEIGLELAQYLRKFFKDKIIGCVGEAKIFYKSDLEQIQRNHLFSYQNEITDIG